MNITQDNTQMPPRTAGSPQSESEGAEASRSLVSKNVRIDRRRTSVRLEPQMWNALQEIAMLEKCSIHDLCTAVDRMKQPTTPFTAALRVFLMEYYRSVSRASAQVNDIQRMIREDRQKSGTRG